MKKRITRAEHDVFPLRCRVCGCRLIERTLSTPQGPGLRLRAAVDADLREPRLYAHRLPERATKIVCDICASIPPLNVDRLSIAQMKDLIKIVIVLFGEDALGRHAKTWRELTANDPKPAAVDSQPPR